MKLSTRLIFIFLSLSVIPMTVIGLIGFRNGINTIKRNTINRLVSVNLSKEAEFNRWINASQSQIKALAQRPLVREFAQKLSSKETPPALRHTLHQKLIDDHLTAGIKAGIGFIDLSILDKNSGEIMVSTDPFLEGKFRENASFFLEGRHRTFVDEVSYWLSVEKVVMHVSTPVKNHKGELIAVLSGHVDWQEMSHIMHQGSGMRDSEESYIINKFNYFVTESRFVKDYPLKKSVNTKGAELCLAQKSGVDVYDDYRGIPVIGVYRWMPRWGLCMITEQDQQEAFAPAVTFRNVVLGASLGVGVLVTVIALLFVRNITARIRHLVKGAEAFSLGRFDFKIDIHRRDELGMLAESFNRMAQARKKAEDTIRRSRDELEVRVKERTWEIANANELLKKEINERRQIEEALRGSEQEYRMLVENLDTAVVVHQKDTSILMSNFRAQELLGLSQEQMQGKEAIDPAWHFLSEDGNALPLESYPVNLVIASGRPLRNYVLGICNPKIDSIVWVMVNAFPKLDNDQRLEQVVVTFWDITYRKAAEEKIQQSLTEKDVLLREIHHRVKNNMQMIQSLLNLQANKMDEPAFKASLVDSNSRIKSMALVHETLYRSEDIANLDLGSYFRQLVKHLYKIYVRQGKRIESKFLIEPVCLDMDASIACGLIVNELVTNALKYAFNGSPDGVIEIGIRKTNDQEIELSVSDNGVGLPDQISMEHGRSLGLKIVSMLAQDQLHGKITIERETGTRFYIRFPIQPDA